VLSQGIIAGSINLTRVTSTSEVMTMGYWIGQEFTRHGLASKAATMLSEQALSRSDITEVVAYAHPTNTGSQRVLRNAGFLYRGITEDDRRKYAKD
jgi:RimJ/RimL family protein N-acetyltransferase